MTLLNNILASLPFMNAERADEVISSFWPMMEAAIDKTIPLAVISFFAGVAIALIVALIRIVEKPNLGIRLLQILCRIYVSTIRGTPMLVQIFIIFYGLPEVGIKLDPFPTAIIAFSINIGAYASETIRAAILSIPKGQGEVAGQSPDFAAIQSGIASYQKRDLDAAYREFSRAIAINGENPTAFVNRGIVLRDMKRYEDALAFYVPSCRAYHPTDDICHDIFYDERRHNPKGKAPHEVGKG